ncbi:MAG: acetyl-CoA synthetase [Ruminococcaceae bacterium]|nr:acetyl-CoA synthetase [Oscillospiraceae bacterium]
MAIYEKYIGGRSRDSFSSYEELHATYKVSCSDTFNFAYDVLDVLGETKPDKLALVWLSETKEKKTFTFSEMSKASNKAANYFKSLGIRKGDRVLLVLRRSYYFWICLMGLHKIGAIAVQATDMLTKKDYIYRCNEGKIKCAIVTDHGDSTSHFDEGLSEYKTVEMRCVIGHKQVDGWIDFEAGYEAASDEWTRPTGDEDVCADDILMMCFSSGTTGFPKMITHDHRYPLGHIMTGVFWHRVVDGGLHFTVSDTGWMKSIWGKMYGQWFGETAILVYDFDRFNAPDILSVLESEKVTTFCVPPTMYRMLLLEDVSKYDLSSIKHCCTAGEALNPDIFNQWLKYTGLKIYEGFGQSETPVCISTLYPWMEPIPGAIGLPTPGYDMQIIDDNGEPCTRGETGEICIKATRSTKPYGLINQYNWSDEDTDHAYRGGYYHTGDTAYQDELGYFRYVGRNDDVIKSSGYRIGPFEIESVLLEHPAVLETAVTGVPDPLRGFNVKATIVLREGFTPSDELTKELQNFVKKNTAPYKYPRIVEYVNELPKTFSGKIRRVAIREKDCK